MPGSKSQNKFCFKENEQHSGVRETCKLEARIIFPPTELLTSQPSFHWNSNPPPKLSLSPLPDAKDPHGCKFKNTLNKKEKKRKIEEVLLEWKSEGWHYALMRSPTVRLKENNVARSD